VLAPPSLAAPDRQCLALQPPVRLGFSEDITGCHAPGGPFYNKISAFISKISAFCQVSAPLESVSSSTIVWALC